MFLEKQILVFAEKKNTIRPNTKIFTRK